MEGLQPFVIAQHLRAVIGKDAPPAVLQQLLDIEVRRLHVDALEAVLAGVSADAVDRGHPESPLLVAEDVLDLVVRQARRVVQTEILVVLVAVVAVQATERAYPQLS